MKVINVTSSPYIDFNEENIKESSKFKIDDNVRISKYKNIFVKSYVSNCSEEVFMIKKLHCTMRHGALHHGDML